MHHVADFPPNTAGSRDFVAGDVHGCFATLEAALDELEYDAGKDRLFSLGDLIDYGARSAEALKWMQSRFAGTVRGNHEDMMRDWLVLGSRMWNEGRSWRQHWASAWCPGVAEPEPALRDAWLPVLDALPFTLTIALPDGGRVGLVHGYGGLVRPVEDVDWDDLCSRIENDRHAAWGAMWTRPFERRPSPADPGLPPGIASVEYVLHGHEPGPVPAWTGHRMLCIDTGVHVPELGHLTIAELRPGTPVLHSFGRIDDLLPEPGGSDATA